MKIKWKILFIGVGSIAKRHIKNIHDLCEQMGDHAVIDIFRSGNGKELDAEVLDIISVCYTEYHNIPSDYDIIFITNPTQYHMETLKKFHANGRHFFIEKPVCTVEQIQGSSFDYVRENSVYYTACPLRYSAVIQYVKEYVNLSEVRSVRSMSSSYLPDWRQGVDYRRTYSARKELGGGVAIDLIHEWDYICYLFGFPKNVYSILKKVSSLEINSEDIAVYIADYKDKTVELHLDYFGRYPIRQLELMMDNDTVLCDLIGSSVSYKKEGRVIHFDQERNSYQMRELQHFMNLIINKNYKNYIKDAQNILEIAGGRR